MRVYSEKDLTDMGYVETKPGIFERVKSAPNPQEKKKKVPDHLKHIKAGKYVVGGNTYRFRSGWEHIYAMYLELLRSNGSIKDWKYECQRFDFPGIKRGCVSYLPDFKVIENDDSHWWAEVKGYLSPQGATRLKRMAKYFPNEKVRLVREPEIQDIKISGILGSQI